MKLVHTVFCITSLLSAPALSDIPAVFDVPEIPHTCPQSPFGTACYHMTGGRNTRVALPVIPDEPCEQVQLQLYELSERLEAPVGIPIIANCRDVSLEFPAVKALTYFKLTRTGVMEHREKEFRKDSDPTHATLLAVYPADQLASLKEWSQSNRVIVKDEKQKLIPFLEAQGIRYARATDPLPPEEKGKALCLWVSDEPPQNTPERCLTIVTFRAPLYALTSLREVTIGGKHIFELDDALLSSLDTNPLIQRIFAQIIQSALEGDRS